MIQILNKMQSFRNEVYPISFECLMLYSQGLSQTITLLCGRLFYIFHILIDSP